MDWFFVLVLDDIAPAFEGLRNILVVEYLVDTVGDLLAGLIMLAFFQNISTNRLLKKNLQNLLQLEGESITLDSELYHLLVLFLAIVQVVQMSQN